MRRDCFKRPHWSQMPSRKGSLAETKKVLGGCLRMSSERWTNLLAPGGYSEPACRTHWCELNTTNVNRNQKTSDLIVLQWIAGFRWFLASFKFQVPSSKFQDSSFLHPVLFFFFAVSIRLNHAQYLSLFRKATELGQSQYHSSKEA